MKIVLINKKKCIGCARCVDLCSKKILYLDDKGICEVADEICCDKAGGCEKVCPVGAIKIQ